MPATRRHLGLVLPLVAVALAGCGSEERRAAPPNDASPAPGAAPDTGAGSTGRVVVPEDDQEADDDEQPAPPTPAAQRAGRGLDRLVAAYAPATRRVNFLVTAETLRDDAVESGADDRLQRERAGLVRIESARMDAVLELARTRVEAVAVATDAQQRVRASLLEAIDARTRAMAELRAALTAIGRELPDSVVQQRLDMWEQSWDASLRSAREATTAMQLEREALALPPAPEESLR